MVATADPAHADAPARTKQRTNPCNLLTRRDIREVTGWHMPRGSTLTYQEQTSTSG